MGKVVRKSDFMKCGKGKTSMGRPAWREGAIWISGGSCVYVCVWCIYMYNLFCLGIGPIFYLELDLLPDTTYHFISSLYLAGKVYLALVFPAYSLPIEPPGKPSIYFSMKYFYWFVFPVSVQLSVWFYFGLSGALTHFLTFLFGR